MKTLLAILLFLIVETPARPQAFKLPIVLQCNTTEIVLDLLREKYMELPTGSGLASGEQVRLFESHHAGDKQTWTLVISNPNGLSCIIKGGENWITNPKIPKGDPS